MVHLRIVAPTDGSRSRSTCSRATPSASNLIFLPGAAHKPEGDVILCDVAREDASVIIGDLQGADITGTARSRSSRSIRRSRRRGARREGRAGAPTDAVVWEEVEASTSENTELGANFLAFMVLACLIAAVGIYLDSPILIIGGMVVGPEFGPMAGLCVAIVQRGPKSPSAR